MKKDEQEANPRYNTVSCSVGSVVQYGGDACDNDGDGTSNGDRTGLGRM